MLDMVKFRREIRVIVVEAGRAAVQLHDSYLREQEFEAAAEKVCAIVAGHVPVPERPGSGLEQ